MTLAVPRGQSASELEAAKEEAMASEYFTTEQGGEVSSAAASVSPPAGVVVAETMPQSLPVGHPQTPAGLSNQRPAARPMKGKSPLGIAVVAALVLVGGGYVAFHFYKRRANPGAA